jgi:hypothetical protein
VNLGEIRPGQRVREQRFRFFDERDVLFARCELNLETLWTVETRSRVADARSHVDEARFHVFAPRRRVPRLLLFAPFRHARRVVPRQLGLDERRVFVYRVSSRGLLR